MTLENIRKMNDDLKNEKKITTDKKEKLDSYYIKNKDIIEQEIINTFKEFFEKEQFTISYKKNHAGVVYSIIAKYGQSDITLNWNTDLKEFDISFHKTEHVAASGNSNYILLSFDNDKFQYRSIWESPSYYDSSKYERLKNGEGAYYNTFKEVLENLEFLK